MEPDTAAPEHDNFQFIANDAPASVAISPVWRRFVAFFIDCTFLGLAGYLSGISFFNAYARLGGWGRLVGFTIALVYFGLFDSIANGGKTPGKRLCRIKVVDSDGKPLSIAKSIVRYLVIAGPFFLNGLALPSGTLWSSVGQFVGLVVIGLGGGIIYLLLFNRPTRQSLHDLVAGSYVIRADSQGPGDMPKIWKGHFLVLGAWMLAVSVLVTVGMPFLARSSVFAGMTELQRQVEKLDKVRAVSINTGVMRGQQGKTRFLRLNAILAEPCAEFEDLTDRIAATVFTVYPKAAELDQVTVTLAYGYDIGIASSWRYRQAGHAPGDWKFKLEGFSGNAPAGPASKLSASLPVATGGLVSFSEEREVFQKELRELLYREEFARLEQVAGELRHERPRFSSGLPKLNDFYKAVGGEARGPVKPDMDRHKQLLEKWMAARPDSLTPRIAMILIYTEYAWKARGGGWAKDVTKEGQEGFERNLESARKLIVETEKMDIDDPTIYALALIVSKGLATPMEETSSFLDKGVKIDPNFDPLYIYMANYLLPRWHGSPKELHDFALRAVELAGPDFGYIMYLRVAAIAQLHDGNTFRTQYPFSWPRLKRGLDELDRRFPNSARTINLYGWFACRYRDVEAARTVMPRLGWGVDEAKEIWEEKSTFDACNQWLNSTAQR